MSDRLEWAHATAGAELLFPGEDIDGATVDSGELAIAFWGGSNGIALLGPPHVLADRLEQAAAIARSAVSLFDGPQAHLPGTLQPDDWAIFGARTSQSTDLHDTLCETLGIIVRDPRHVTCGNCVAIWNGLVSEEYAFPVVACVPQDPADRTGVDQLPYATLTWLHTVTEAAPGNDTIAQLPSPDTNPGTADIAAADDR